MPPILTMGYQSDMTVNYRFASHKKQAHCAHYARRKPDHAQK